MHSSAFQSAPVAALLCLAGFEAAAQENLGFEAVDGASNGQNAGSWQLDERGRGGGERDDRVARTGSGSWRLAASREPRGTRLAQSMPAGAFHGERVRISAYVKVEPGAAAALWVRIDGPGGLLYLDRSDAASKSGEWLAVAIDAPVSTHAERISFGGSAHGTGSVWFDDFSVAGVDTSIWPPPSAPAERYLDRALDHMQERSINRGEIAWPGFRAAARAQARGAQTVEDAHLAVRFAVSELGDGHSYFMPARQMSALGERAVANARTGRRAIPPTGRLLEGSIGLITVPGVAGGDQHAQAGYAQTLHRLIGELDGNAPCGWIVDLSDNSGGNLWPMLAGVGPLLPAGEAVAAVFPNGERQSLWYADGKAGLGDFVQLRVNSPYRVRAERPVAVLTSRTTASSAEIIVAALRGGRSALTFGTATRGVSTATRTIPLSDGSALILAVAATSDRNGRIYDSPIEPDVEARAAGSGATSTAPAAVEAAAQWLKRQPSCTELRYR